MAKVRIFEKIRGEGQRIREAEVPEDKLRDFVDYLFYVKGLYQERPREYTFQVKAPCLLYLIKELEEKWPEIKFVEVKPDRFHT